jgi:hypothetical protein
MAFPDDDEKMKGCRPKLFGTKDKKVVKRADYQSCSAVKSGPSSSKSQSSSPFRTLTGGLLFSIFATLPHSIHVLICFDWIIFWFFGLKGSFCRS